MIELIYQAAKAKMTGAGGQPKPGGQALMDMLRQLLGMDNDSQSAEQQDGEGEGEGEGQNGSQKGKGNNPGHGADGKSNMASYPGEGRFQSGHGLRKQERAPFPNPPACPRTTCPANFRKALDAYNKTLQK